MHAEVDAHIVCDAVLSANGEILMIADDRIGFGPGVPLRLSDDGILSAWRGRRRVVVGRLPRALNLRARESGEILFHCARSGRTDVVRHPAAEEVSA